MSISDSSLLIFMHDLCNTFRYSQTVIFFTSQNVWLITCVNVYRKTTYYNSCCLCSCICLKYLGHFYSDSN